MQRKALTTYLLNLMSKYLPTVVVTQSSANHHPGHSLRLQEDVIEVDNSHLKCFIAGDLSLSLEEALEQLNN